VELAVGPGFDGVDLREVSYEAIPVSARIEANGHLVAAAEAVLEIDALTPSRTYRSDLLWQAAELYDKAGRPRKALALYERFVDGEADHQNRPEAMYRIALGLHGMMRFEEAGVWYRRLLEEGEAKPDEKSGYWTRAKVGLARALLAMPGSGGSLEAERLLRDFLEGREVDPRSVDYRDATFHLGRLLVGQERWLEAVEGLEPWLGRYPEDARWGEASALAGVAWLNRAERLASQLDDDSTRDLEHSPISPGYRAELEISRRSALMRALERFEGVVDRLDGVDPPLLSPLQRHLLRVAGLQRGTVRERLGEVEAAIAVYREVEQRFAEEPVAVEALVSLANLASRIGDGEMARKATRRARIKLQRIEQRRRLDGVSTGGEGDRLERHGPDLFVGGGSSSLDRWLRLFPPGGGGGAG
jgi:tetratricopeptide (TPR) repeat protein